MFTSNRIRGKCPRLCQEGFRLDIRTDLFTERVIRLWNGLHRVVVESLCLDVFKRPVDMVLRDVV